MMWFMPLAFSVMFFFFPAGLVLAAVEHAACPLRFVSMAPKNLQDSSPSHWPEAAQPLIALMHAQGEVARLSEREQLLNTLLASVNAVLWALDWETRKVLYVSPAYERIFGRSADLLLADSNQWRDSIHQAELGQPVIIVGIAEDITNKKQMETELHRLATIDALTQSSNRRHFFECAHRAFTHARQQGEPLSFLMLDIDNFKTVNDTYGHQEGDYVLQRIAESGRAALRRRDLFGRIGGEEFAAVFPGCTPQMALQVAERLQRQIQQLSFNHEGRTFGITVSQGLTSLTATDENVENLFSRADAAMYQAKREGKNRIVTA